MPVGMAIVYSSFPKEKVGAAIGLWGVAAMVAPALGPTFGGYLIQYYSWRLLFFINIPIGILAVIIGKFLLKESPKQVGLKFDTPGAVLSMIFFGTLLLALSKGQSERLDIAVHYQPSVHRLLQPAAAYLGRVAARSRCSI